MKDEEIERRFLLAVIPKGIYVCSMINQGYLVVDDRGGEVRLRDEDGNYIQAVKLGRGHIRKQYETALIEHQFYRLWPATEGRRLRKERRRIPYAGLTVEVDRYLDNLSGLIMAEVEFPTDEASRKFEPPDWFGLEVTDRPEYSNCNLAVHGLPECFADDLKKMTEASDGGK